MPININDGMRISAPRLLDLRQGKIVGGAATVPYASTAEALSRIPVTRRSQGLIIYVQNGLIIEQWQFTNGVADSDLKLIFDGTGSGGGVQSVTGVNTDNSDAQNPVIYIATDESTLTGDGTADNPLALNQVFTDGTTITGLGTEADPLVATGGGGGGPTPDLQAVTDVGFTTTNSINAGPVLSATVAGTDVLIYALNSLTNTAIALSINSDDSPFLQFNKNGGTFCNLFAENVTSPRTWQLPDGNGTLALSVNGNVADSTGNITIAGGGADRLGIEDITGVQHRYFDATHFDFQIINGRTIYLTSDETDGSSSGFYATTEPGIVKSSIKAGDATNQVSLNLYPNQASFYLPANSQSLSTVATGDYIIPLSVNGNVADSTGNILLTGLPSAVSASNGLSIDGISGDVILGGNALIKPTDIDTSTFNLAITGSDGAITIGKDNGVDSNSLLSLSVLGGGGASLTTINASTSYSSGFATNNTGLAQMTSTDGSNTTTISTLPTNIEIDVPVAGYISILNMPTGVGYVLTDVVGDGSLTLQPSSGGGVGTLQTVTDAGNTTTNSIISSNAIISSGDSTGGNIVVGASDTITDASIGVTIAIADQLPALVYTQTNAISGVLKADTLDSSDKTWQLPNQSGTIALLTDIGGGGTVPNLQQVTDEGFTTTNKILSITDGSTNVAGVGAGNTTTNDSISVGIQVAETPALEYIISGNRGLVHADNITDTRSWQLPDASGTIALTSAINLQSVTDGGNSTDNSIVSHSSFVAVHDDTVETSFSATNTTSGSSITMVNGGTWTLPALVFNDGTNTGILRGGTITSIRSWEFPDKSGTVFIINAGDNYANDAAAAAGGVDIGQGYHNAGAVRIRLV